MQTEVTDVCVIGSGAGGGVTAWHAAKGGRRTLIVERGPYVRASDMSHEELKMLPKLYKDGGLQLNTTLDMFILQGSCVGGSTILANNVMFRASDEVLAEWKRLGANFEVADLQAAYHRVERQLGVISAPRENASSGSYMVHDGAKALGMDVRWMLKALGGCTGCGGCNIGCVWDHKKSSMTTYIRWAEQHGARVLAETTIDKIEYRRGKVVGLLGRTGPDKRPIRIQAKSVVVAGGAIGSSGLLLKSGITRNVGRRLSFNAGAPMLAEFEQPIDAFDGDQMSLYVKGDGYTIEPINNPPGATALMTPGWMEDHSRLMKRMRHIAFAGALVGTEPVGRVVHSPFFGHEETRFVIPDGSMAKLRKGMKAVAKVFLAAGAKQVFLPTHSLNKVRRLEDVDGMDSLLMSRKQFDRGSSHPQGGNAWSDDPDIGVVDRDFAVHGFENLFVSDASVFPSCISLNPINTIFALADYAAPRILARC